MSTVEEQFHHRLGRVERSTERIMAAPTVPKYDLIGPATNNLLLNMSEIGNAHSTTLGTSITMTVDFENVRPTDMIFVMAMAPSLPYSGPDPSYAETVTDSQGHIYYQDFFSFGAFEDATALVNTGVGVSFFRTDPTSESLPGLVAGSDTITAEWPTEVYDRFMQAWLIRFEPDVTSSFPTMMTMTTSYSTVAYAASQILLPIPNIGAVTEHALLFGLLVNAYGPSRSIGYGGVGGYSGFYEASGTAKFFSSSRQNYAVHQQTHKANSYVVAGDVPQSYEIDQGTSVAGETITAFNGFAQAYTNVPALTPATNFWKGGIVWLVEN